MNLLPPLKPESRIARTAAEVVGAATGALLVVGALVVFL